jgi:hypothetical protein
MRSGRLIRISETELSAYKQRCQIKTIDGALRP